jgi:cytidylate kinase
MIVAIDGPAASGKSSVARAVATELGALFLNTGAMYRACGAAARAAGIDLDDAEACGRVARDLVLDFDAAGGLRIDGAPAPAALQDEANGAAASRIAAHGPVRDAMVARQREIAAGRDTVTEGRDTTTVVFPDADHKFFLWATAATRARRRADEEGRPERYEAYLADLEARDQRDTERAIAPLRQAADAVRIDTDDLPLAAVIARVLEVVRPA